MWLDNYYKMVYIQSAAGAYDGKPVDLSDSPIYGTNGTARDYVLKYTLSYELGYTIKPSATIASQLKHDYADYTDRPNLVVGSGTTPASASDYRLESEITTLTCSVITGVSDPINGTVTYKKTMTNKSSETISVSEIGLVRPAWSYPSKGSTSGGTVFTVLGYREVLDTPIVVPAGDTFTVSITHKFAMFG